MGANWTIDLTQLNRALQEYHQASQRSFPEVCNRTARNLMYRTVQNMPNASRGAILQLAMAEWWPKFIAKLISGKGVAWGHAGYTTKKGKKVAARVWRYQGAYTVAQARQVSRRLLGTRARSVSFLKSGFAKAGRQIPGRGPAGTAPSHLTFSQASVSPASMVKFSTDILVAYLSKSKPDTAKDAAGKERIARTALEKAVAFVVKDMREYIERKQAELAAEHSARAA